MNNYFGDKKLATINNVLDTQSHSERMSSQNLQAGPNMPKLQ